jgi:serine phosphatase RsbU (regulator of sigma subunit)
MNSVAQEFRGAKANLGGSRAYRVIKPEFDQPPLALRFSGFVQAVKQLTSKSPRKKQCAMKGRRFSISVSLDRSAREVKSAGSSQSLTTAAYSANEPGKMPDKRATVQSTPAAERPRRVLLVDDDAASRRLLGASLQNAGFELSAMADGAEALAAMESSPPDVLVLDFAMPGLDGAEVCRRLRASKRTALNQLPIIMLTGHTGEAEEIACLTAGVNDFVTKPVSRAVLVARIETQLRLGALSAVLRTQNREMARWREAQEADLAVARTAQQAIVTSALPRIDGWQVEAVYTPLIQVGGDVYGWRQLERGIWLFWLADATGHGVAAALFTTLAALLFNHASATSRTANGILTHVNAEFYSVLRGHAFMTACCAVIEDNGRLSFAGAGHPPLLIRRRAGMVETLLSLNPMMGIDQKMEVGETETMLASGDVALLYTDGLFSLKAQGGERFTSDTVADVFARIDGSAELLPQLIAQLSQRAGEQPFDDDLASIALRRE